MTSISVILGLGAAILLLAAGYLYGARLGSKAREHLRTVNLQQAEKLKQLQDRVSEQAGQQDSNLRNAIQQLLVPLVQREEFSLGLSQLEASPGQHRDLTLLLDQILEIGKFSTVLISNEEGLPVASNSAAQDVERLAATSSLLLLMADRMAGADRPAPLSFMLHDEANSTTLCRIFRVRDQRLSLTAVCSGSRLTPTALDPALARVEALLGAPS